MVACERGRSVLGARASHGLTFQAAWLADKQMKGPYPICDHGKNA